MCAAVIALLDIIETGNLLDHDAGPVVQLTDKIIVVVGQKKLSLYVQKQITKPEMIVFRKPAFADILVVALCVVIGRIEVEEGGRTIIVKDQLFKVLMLNDHSPQPPVGLLNQREITPHIMGFPGKAGETGGVAVADDLVKPGRFLYVAGRAVAGEGGADTVKILPRVEDVFQRRHQFFRLLPDAAVQVHQQTVEVVVDLIIVSAGLVEQYPAASTKYLHVALIEEWEPLDHLLPQRLLSPDPADEAVQEPSPVLSPNRSSDPRRPLMESCRPFSMSSRLRIVSTTSPAWAA